MKINVIHHSYNRERYMMECIQSVLPQEASTDHTVEILEFFDDYPIKLLNFKVAREKVRALLSNLAGNKHALVESSKT